MTSARVWLITGSSSGFGRSMAELALNRGDNVAATVRNPATMEDLKAQYSSNRLLVLVLDVTQPSAISSVFASAKAAFGRVDIVFNNAGVGLVGEVEGTPEDSARRIFDTNFWGAANVSREAVRFFREENKPEEGGRLLVNSSSGGICPLICNGYYCASKFALEGLTQTLAHEIDPKWNIKITQIIPGYFRTPAYHKGEHLPLHPAYTDPSSAPAKLRVELENIFSAPEGERIPAGDPSKAAGKIYDLSSLSDPPLRVVLGNDAIEAARRQLKLVTGDVDASEAWSEDLMEDSTC